MQICQVTSYHLGPDIKKNHWDEQGSIPDSLAPPSTVLSITPLIPDINIRLCFLFIGIVGVEIRQMRVPAVVQSGSTPFVILDCDYDLSEMEGTQVGDYTYKGFGQRIGELVGKLRAYALAVVRAYCGCKVGRVVAKQLESEGKD